MVWCIARVDHWYGVLPGWPSRVLPGWPSGVVHC